MDEILENDIEPTPEPITIPNIYKFSPETREYLGFEQSKPDIEATRILGHYVPRVPAYATLVEPPTFEENQAAIYTAELIINPDTEESHLAESWEVKPDYRKNFLKVDNDLNVSVIDVIGEIEGYIVVPREYGEEIATVPDWYKIVDNEVVKKSDEEYEQEQSDRREAEFNKAFFNTSLGYIRRSVTMADGSKKDFLSDLLPVISMGVQSEKAVNIIAYNKPPFDKDITDWTKFQKQVTVTPQFIQECFMQLSNDFLPINED